MSVEQILLTSLAMFVVALFYSSVGHAGASGYIAVLTFAQFTISQIKPIALTLNILVSVIVTWQFFRAGYFSWQICLPLVMASVPAAIIGGYVGIPTRIISLIVGLVLLFSAVRIGIKISEPEKAKLAPRPLLYFSGGALGFIAGLTGTGGGIFLSPLLILTGWAKTKNAAAISSFFILVNSGSGLLGYFLSQKSYPHVAWYFAVAAITGGAVGSYLGSRLLPAPIVRRILSVILVGAGLKLLFSANKVV